MYMIVIALDQINEKKLFRCVDISQPEEGEKHIERQIIQQGQCGVDKIRCLLQNTDDLELTAFKDDGNTIQSS